MDYNGNIGNRRQRPVYFINWMYQLKLLNGLTWRIYRNVENNDIVIISVHITLHDTVNNFTYIK